ncbi:VOC family protein [Aestuariicoccus sp. MJ-SS9]|uniref:VOC family protein n=1 Tax=Aestuariicoccus sp. MJ-SS9 TaxID=3079855 RepID=UPI00290F1AEA|nr:VOC family protein [Aestuariicoccus sp. MJ-SS9]MDU8913332.1 VOC family protein [Aestuariicoccus sp. MJ-SS9]
MPITGVNHITLCVTDLDRSLAFYRDVLGGRLAAGGGRAAYLELGTLWLCLEVAAAVATREDDSHFALACAPRDFDALAARIDAHAPRWKENRSEGASLYFRDPDGHKLELHVGELESRLAHYRAHPDKGMEVVDT